MRDRSWRRGQAARHVRRRLRRVYHLFRDGGPEQPVVNPEFWRRRSPERYIRLDEYDRRVAQPGRMRKQHTWCGCVQCRLERRARALRRRRRQAIGAQPGDLGGL